MSSHKTSPTINLLPTRWVRGFVRRSPELALRPVWAIEALKIEAVTRHNVAAHITRVQAAMDRFHMHDTNRIFIVDEAGISSRKWREGAFVEEWGTRAK